MADSHFTSILATIRSGEFSDLKFVCNDKAFFVHKNIVCTQSSVLNSTIKVRLAESVSDTISMHGFEIPTVESFVQFLYTGDYANTKQEGQEGSQQDGNVRPELLGHIHCREIASRFKVDRLMNPSRAKLEALIDKHQDSSDLRSALPAAIRLAHTVSTSQDVMDLLSASVARNIDELMDDDLLSNISDVPEFLLAVLKHSARNASQLKTERAKRMQELKEQEQTASTIPEGSLKLPRDTKSWINNYCKMSFNAEFTDAFELICRGCHSNQDLAKFQKPKPSSLFFGAPASSRPLLFGSNKGMFGGA